MFLDVNGCNFRVKYNQIKIWKFYMRRFCREDIKFIKINAQIQYQQVMNLRTNNFKVSFDNFWIFLQQLNKGRKNLRSAFWGHLWKNAGVTEVIIHKKKKTCSEG